MAKMKGLDGKEELLVLDEIQFDESYQRDIKPHHRNIARDFDPAAAGRPTVARRGSQGLFCVDGRQRITAMKTVGIAKWKCVVVESSGPAYEAYLFRLLNDGKNRKSPNPRELFRAALSASDPTAVAVKALVEKHGLSLGLSGQKEFPHVKCVSLLYRLHQNDDGPRVLDRTLELLLKLWPGSSEALHETVLGGLCLIVRNREVDEARLLATVGQKSPRMVRVETPSSGGSGRYYACADFMIGLYNRKLKSGSGRALRLFSDKAPLEASSEDVA